MSRDGLFRGVVLRGVHAALPSTENHKVQKFKLRDRGITPASWDREAAGIKLAR